MNKQTKDKPTVESDRKNAALILADGAVFFGSGIGAEGTAFGEICFNTSMTGYQEILTDPSYSGQVITFTFPHIGNVGTNSEDVESKKVHATGLVLRDNITNPSNFRSEQHFNDWLKANNVTGIYGIDTRAITRKIRLNGAQNVAIAFANSLEEINIEKIKQQLKDHPSMEGLELAAKVTCAKPYEWKENVWQSPTTNNQQPITSGKYHVVAIDYGAKHNILRCLVSVGCKVTVVPAKTTVEEIMSYNPDGIFLSNGPGDPAATAEYALPVIQSLITNYQIPIFGICLGHQLLGLALGCKTEKMKQGHRGANHPVKDIFSGKVMITSQNHGFVISKQGIPKDVELTHISLFDQTIQGIRLNNRPVFSVQGHPEASPGPHDTYHLFEQFAQSMKFKVKSVKLKVSGE